MPFTDELAEYIIRTVRDLGTQVNDARLGETPFVNGVLSPSAGGTGIANTDSHTLTLPSAGTLDLGGFTLTLVANTTPAPNDVKYIVQQASSALSAEQSLGALATGILKSTTTTGVLSIATGSDLPSHVHDGADITSGTVAAARLGATPTATKLLFGDNTWAVLAAADIPSLAATIITSGTMATARLGSGSATATTLLHGDSTWSAVDVANEVTGLLAGVNGGTGVNNSGKTLTIGTTGTAAVGTGANTRVAYWSGTNTLTSDTGLTFDGTDLSIGGGGIATVAGNVWKFGTYASGTIVPTGKISVVIDNTNYLLDARLV